MAAGKALSQGCRLKADGAAECGRLNAGSHVVTPRRFAGKRQILGCAWLFTFLVVTCLSALSQPCDPQVTPVDNWEIRYRERGDRCEGFYRAEVSAPPTIEVVGVTHGPFDFPLDEDTVVELSCPLAKDRSVQIRAVGIPLKIYYRMDAVLEPEEVLRWPLKDVLYPQKVLVTDVGVKGWFEGVTEGSDGLIYVPLLVATEGEPPSEDLTIRLCLRTSVDVETVKWRFSSVEDGSCSKLSEWIDVEGTTYSAGKPISIALQECEAGECCVEVAARDLKTARWLTRLIRVVVGEVSINEPENG